MNTPLYQAASELRGMNVREVASQGQADTLGVAL